MDSRERSREAAFLIIEKKRAQMSSVVGVLGGGCDVRVVDGACASTNQTEASAAVAVGAGDGLGAVAGPVIAVGWTLPHGDQWEHGPEEVHAHRALWKGHHLAFGVDDHAFFVIAHKGLVGAFADDVDVIEREGIVFRGAHGLSFGSEGTVADSCERASLFG